MKVNLHIYNPTPHARTQWVLYGSEVPHNVFRELPRSFLNVGYVTVPPTQSDKVITFDTDDKPAGDGLLSKAVRETLAGMFRPFLKINGNEHHFVLREVTDLRADFTVGTWTLRGSGIVARLWTYYGKQDDVMRFEVVYCAESLDVLRKQYSVSMGVDAHAVIVRISGKARDHADHLLDHLLIDAQGQRVLGSFIFYRDAFTSGAARRDTMLAEDAYPLYGLHDWKRWGPWRKEPVSVSGDEFERQLKNKASVRWRDPFTWPGYLTNKNPGDTGAQPGFGTWQHVPTIGARRSEAMLVDQLIAAQESCRPNHFFEEDGSDLDSLKHPNFVPWDELPHYSEVVSPDRLRRKRGWSLTSFDWYGHDRQHYCSTWLAEDVLLNGSYASAWELARKADLMVAGLTLESRKPRWSTNSGLSGRDGRMFLAAAYNWAATGNKDLLRHLVQRFDENIGPRFTVENSPGPLHVSRVIWNDPRVFGKDRAGWIVWEDALMVMGMDAMARALFDAELTIASRKFERVAAMIAKTVAAHGWHPTRNIIAKAILWRDKNTRPLSAAEWEDEKKVLLATGTDYDVWAVPCLEIAARNGLQRAKDLLRSIKLDPDNPIHHVYMGTQ